MLDPAYSGVVVSTSSRFYTAIETLPQPTRGDGPIQIRVRSPQFVNASWLYFVDFAGPDGVRVEHIGDRYGFTFSCVRDFAGRGTRTVIGIDARVQRFCQEQVCSFSAPAHLDPGRGAEERRNATKYAVVRARHHDRRRQ